MEQSGKLPEDYRIAALSSEAVRRGRKLGRPYSYGQLVADTTQEERDEICQRYESAFRKRSKSGRTKSFFAEADKEGDV